ncbi:glycosyltransferase [Vibrio fluvialis]|nr:glycosyltransferase [Vibrio fluvialis]MBY8086910.1 glycosyltransferase [Vibrio fluvialis]MBY8103955.1 glycosyltransferase [Vibrio fluvialis]
MKLSIILVTYNHEKYIAKALESIYKQNFDFSMVEIIIADDYSTDNTLEMIKLLQSHFPVETTFIYLDRGKNLGITKNYQSAFSACRGEYIAVLEGDDYWISPNRLQCLSDVLDNNFHVGMVSNNYYVYNQTNRTSYLRTKNTVGVDFYVAPQLVLDNIVGNFSTCMYRRSEIEKLPSSLFDIVSYDWIISICITSNSYLAFVNQPMSLYRIHENGVWSSESDVNKINEQINTITKYDELTEYIFSSEFKQVKNRLNSQLKLLDHVVVKNKTIKNAVKNLIRLSRDYVPPIVSVILRYVMPPKIIKLLSKVR